VESQETGPSVGKRKKPQPVERGNLCMKGLKTWKTVKKKGMEDRPRGKMLEVDFNILFKLQSGVGVASEKKKKVREGGMEGSSNRYLRISSAVY